MNPVRPQAPKRPKELWKNWSTWLLIGMALSFALSWLPLGSSTPKEKIPELPYSAFLKDLEMERVVAIADFPLASQMDPLKPLDFEVRLLGGKNYRTTFPQHLPAELRKLWEAAPQIQILSKEVGWRDRAAAQLLVRLQALIFSELPWLMLWFLILTFMLRVAGLASPFSFWERESQPEEMRSSREGEAMTFADIAGNEEAKAETHLLVQFLKTPEPFEALGARLPKGLLLSGPPGTGKTLLAKAVAGEAHVPFLACSGSQFEEKYVGVGASRIRALFRTARKQAPCLIFIDEIDSIAHRRHFREGSGSSLQTLNQLLVEMDGFEGRGPIVVIAATNRPEELDPALTRPGRFDRRIILQAPPLQEREAILKLYGQKVKMEEGFPYERAAQMTPGFVGSDLANLINEGALRAAELKAEAVRWEHVEYAYDRMLLGSPRRSLRPTAEALSRTAYHEAGHALVSLAFPGADSIRKLTILPSGEALGATLTLAEEERLHVDAIHLKQRLAICCGGRAAEALVYGPAGVSTGASSGPSSDFAVATRLAYRMVAQHGLIEGVGMVYHELGSWRETPLSSPGLAKVERAVKALLDEAYQHAFHLLERNRSLLQSIHDALLEKETLDLKDLEKLLKKHPIQTEVGGAQVRSNASHELASRGSL